MLAKTRMKDANFVDKLFYHVYAGQLVLPTRTIYKPEFVVARRLKRAGYSSYKLRQTLEMIGNVRMGYTNNFLNFGPGEKNCEKRFIHVVYQKSLLIYTRSDFSAQLEKKNSTFLRHHVLLSMSMSTSFEKII